MQKQHKYRRYSRGGILISVLAYVVVISLIMAGVTTLSVSHYTRVRSESDYANALDAAEAGANYELNRISNNAANVDQKNATGAPGHNYSTTAGNFSVYVTQRNSDGTETTPWTAPNNLWVYSTGTVNGISRTVKLAARGFTSALPGNYAVFGVLSGSGNGNPAVQGDIGTNGTIGFVGHPSVTGSVIFNGPGSGWSSSTSGYTVVYNAQPVVWPTVDQIANQQFPSGGIAWLATHNDNLLAVPPILSSSVSLTGNGSQTFVGKVGGSNYYLTSLDTKGNSSVTFNNTLGPITIWMGPSGGSGTFSLRGGAAQIKMSTDPSKPVRFYVATSNTISLAGNSELDAGIYAVNSASGSGAVSLQGTSAMYSSIICNTFSFGGTPNIYYTGGYFSPSGFDHYEAVVPWVEVNGAN